MKVLGMGNALVDVLARIENDTLLQQMGLPKGSMQLIDDEKRKKLHAAIENMDKNIAAGGSASNTITGIAKLGIKAGFIGKTGNDWYGNYYKENLKKHGVTPHLIEVKDQHSGIATTFISNDGERTFGTYLGAAASLLPEDLDEEIFSQYQYLYIEGYLVQNLDLIETALKMAKKTGLKIALDLASYNIVEENREFLIKVIPEYVDILFANEEEIKTLLNISPEEAIDKLEGQSEICVIKVGAKGSWVRKATEKVFVPSKQVNCIDTTGAGDYYAAGFLCGLINGMPLIECGNKGTLLAQEIIQVIGAELPEKRWEAIKSNI